MFAVLALVLAAQTPTKCFMPSGPDSWSISRLDPWKKVSSDGSHELAVDPHVRSGLGASTAVMRDRDGHELWTRELGYSLREAEITSQGEVLAWARRPQQKDVKSALGLVTLDARGDQRKVEWIEDDGAFHVQGIVVVPEADRAIFRLGRFHFDVILPSDREEWCSLRISDGTLLAQFVPPVTQRPGPANLYRVLPVRDRPLICCEPGFGNLEEGIVDVLDLDGREIWSTVFTRTHPFEKGFYDWRCTPERLSSDQAPGEIVFQRLHPDERIRWRVVADAETKTGWKVSEISREPNSPSFAQAEPRQPPSAFTPRVRSEQRPVALIEGHPCEHGGWSDAAIDGDGRLVVLERDDGHLHRFDASGQWNATIELQDAKEHVDMILALRSDRIDLAFAGSFATWDLKGERLTSPYDRWHRELMPPAFQTIAASRWFSEAGANEFEPCCSLVRYAGDDPLGEITERIARRQDGRWFGRIVGACVGPDGSLLVVDDRAGQPISGGEDAFLSVFDAHGNAVNSMALPLRNARCLHATRGWATTAGWESTDLLLVDLTQRKTYSPAADLGNGPFRLLVPPDESELWIIDLGGKRWLRAALPER